jgi:ATP-dependent Clp protease adapter protein ClpS
LRKGAPFGVEERPLLPGAATRSIVSRLPLPDADVAQQVEADVAQQVEADVAQQVEDDVAQKVRELFGEDYAVIIMDSNFTTFDEVERACIALFGYSRAEAEALSMRVHTTGEALAAVMGEAKARLAVRQLRQRNVLARVEKV